MNSKPKSRNAAAPAGRSGKRGLHWSDNRGRRALRKRDLRAPGKRVVRVSAERELRVLRRGQVEHRADHPVGRRAASKQTVGRPRDERIDTEVVSAVLEALKVGGYRAVTIDGIARRVRRARTSLYRRWPSKRNLVAYAVLGELGDNPASDTGSIQGDLKAAVATLLKAFAGPLGRALPGLVGDMAQDPILAATIRRQVLVARRLSMREALKRAQRRGEVRSGFDAELVLDMLTGPFYYRTLFGHAPLTRGLTERVVRYLLRVLEAAPSGRSRQAGGSGRRTREGRSDIIPLGRSRR